MMTALGLVLAAKIVVTAALITAPFLLFSQKRLAAMSGTESAGSGTFFRLYGVAMLALLAGYASGLWAIAQGRFPWGVVAMGLVSNGGAALVLFLTGAWRRSRLLSLFLIGIAASLGFCGLLSRQALLPLW